MYKLLVMSFDGEYKIENNHGRNFETINETWDFAEDMGSRWFFYPFHFVVTESGKTIKESGSGFENLNNMRVKTVVKLFEKLSKMEEFNKACIEDYMVEIQFLKEKI